MKLQHSCPHTSYYCSQAGHGLMIGGNFDPGFNVFRGTPYQRGYGIFGNVIKRYGIPLLHYLGPRLYRTGKDIASDIYLRNRNPRDAFKDRLKESGRVILKDALDKASSTLTSPQFGSGIPYGLYRAKRKRKSTKKHSNKRRKVIKKRSSNKKKPKVRRVQRKKIQKIRRTLFV